jgi:hypothetical protein
LILHFFLEEKLSRVLGFYCLSLKVREFFKKGMWRGLEQAQQIIDKTYQNSCGMGVSGETPLL